MYTLRRSTSDTVEAVFDQPLTTRPGCGRDDPPFVVPFHTRGAYRSLKGLYQYHPNDHEVLPLLMAHFFDPDSGVITAIIIEGDHLRVVTHGSRQAARLKLQMQLICNQADR